MLGVQGHKIPRENRAKNGAIWCVLLYTKISFKKILKIIILYTKTIATRLQWGN